MLPAQIGGAEGAWYSRTSLSIHQFTEESMGETEKDPRRHRVTSAAEEHNVLIMVSPGMAHHLLRLLADDIARPTGAAPDRRLQVIALACYIRDVLPDSLRIPSHRPMDGRRWIPQTPEWRRRTRKDGEGCRPDHIT